MPSTPIKRDQFSCLGTRRCPGDIVHILQYTFRTIVPNSIVASCCNGSQHAIPCKRYGRRLRSFEKITPDVLVTLTFTIWLSARRLGHLGSKSRLRKARKKDFLSRRPTVK